MMVNLATVTDPYQPAEKEFKITREVLKVFLKHHNPIILTTKSDLILRDLDLLMEMAETGFLNVNITLPTLDEDFRELMEPKVPNVEKRLDTIKILRESKIIVGVTAIPLFPYINDSENEVEKLIKTMAEAGADYVIVDVLNFRGEAKDRVMNFLNRHNSELIPKYEELYQDKYCDKHYQKELRKMTTRLVKKYHVDNFEKMYSYRKKK